MGYVLGVDAGNTKTLAVIVDCTGTVVGVGRSGIGDIYGASSPQHALNNVFSAVRQAVTAAGLGFRDLDASGFSLAGADWPDDFAFWETAIADTGIPQPFKVVNDAIGGLYCGTFGGFGVSVIVGTGGAPGGNLLARAALQAACRAELGMLHATQLCSRLTVLTNAATMQEVLIALTGRTRIDPFPYAGVISELLSAADDGDEVAEQIVVNAGRELGDYAIAAARKVNMNDSYPLVFAGGVLGHGTSLLRDTIISRVQESAQHVLPITGSVVPVVGATSLAVGLQGQDMTLKVRDRIQETLLSWM